MVVLDSDHSEQHVEAELLTWSGLVGVNEYLVVEDTNVNGHPVYRGHGPVRTRPFPALLSSIRNSSRMMLSGGLFSHHQYGWLKRVRE